MRPPLDLPPSLALLVTVALASASAAHWEIAEDLYAFPKYRIGFLNGMPVLNDTAERWLAQGLRGGEREFLDQPWDIADDESTGHGSSQGFQQITSGEETTLVQPEAAAAHGHPDHSRYRLERMQLSGANSYVCLIPPPVQSTSKPAAEQPVEPYPALAWSQLTPLANSCLYYRQGWFTYSYCHNKDVRQFRELALSHPHVHAASYVPEEDPEWESFTLGQADTSTEVANTLQGEAPSNIEIVKNNGHRYLLQRWDDGTICDKTGKPRRIDIQFHCAQVTTDMVLFVKETRTCNYIMVIHTPRLCGVPGFHTRLEQRTEAPVRCREVLSSLEDIEAITTEVQAATGSGDAASRVLTPFPRSRRPRLATLDTSPPAAEHQDSTTTSSSSDKAQDGLEPSAFAALLQDALRMVLGEQLVDQFDIEIVDGAEILLGANAGSEKDNGDESSGVGKIHKEKDGSDTGRLIEALRAAGFDVHGMRGTTKTEGGSQKSNENENAEEDESDRGVHRGSHDEL